MNNKKDTPIYYSNHYGLVFYKSSDRVLSSEELSVTKDCMNGFSSEGLCQLEKILITKDVKCVEWNGLGRFSFRKFEVSKDNPIFQEIDGLLYTQKGYDRHGNTTKKMMIELVACPTNIVSHNVMYGTIRIANCAFKGSHISTITLPNTLKEIGTNAFYFADRIESIDIPMSVQKIESQLARSSFLIKYDDHQFQSWEDLFKYMVEHGFVMKDNKIVKKI